MSLENSSDFLLNFSVPNVNSQEKHFYQFKSFRLEVAERQLLKNGLPVPLMPKMFDVLALLVERGGHLVEKNELLNTVWADSFVEEANIARIIHELRKALGEDKNGNKFIETVAKKGYRFVAKVTEVREPEQVRIAYGNERDDAENESAPTAFDDLPVGANSSELAHNAAPSTVKQKPNTRIMLFAVGFLSAVFLIGLLFSSFRSDSAPDLNKVKSIAILPVQPLTPENRDAIYELGIADSLILKLGSIKGFIVRPLSATRNYTDINQDAIAAGREQQVDFVLASNYQIANGKIRVTAQLFNVATGQIEETYKSEKDTGNVFAAQDAIAGEVGNILSARFAAISNSLTANRGTSNEEAYRIYLQAMYLVDKRNPADTRKAIGLLQEAVRLDPNYARGWAGKAHAHRSAANFGRGVNIHEEYQKSIEAVNKALAMDENLAEAHSVLCENKMYYEYDFASAERSCRRAIELDPNSSLAHSTYSRYLDGRGRHDEAIAEIKTAIDLEPTSLYNQRWLGNSLQYAGRYTEAVAQFKRVIAMDENFGTTYGWLSTTLALQGNESEAFEWWMKGLGIGKRDVETVQGFQAAYQASGWLGVMRERVKRFEKGGEAYFHGAAHNAQVGNKDKAFEYLEKSFERREVWMGYLEVDPRFDSLHGDPRFDELIGRIGSK